MTALSIFALAVGIALSAMLAWLTAEILCGLKPLAACSKQTSTAFRVIVPAHDEASGLAAMLRDLLEIVSAEAVLVVADNCSDATAMIAREAGVEVAERHDPSRRGKGYALAHAREYLAARAPAVIMVLDADCRVARGGPSLLAARAATEQCVIQATNLQLAGDRASPLVRIGAFGFLVKNLVRARGLERLGGGGFLQGTGMVMRWDLFARLPLATGNAVEDVELTAALARLGIPVRLDERCRVVSLAPGRAAHREQRRRWEQGFVRTGLTHGMPLIARGFFTRSRLRFAIGCHMMVPPLALLFALVGTTIAATGTIVWYGLASVALLMVPSSFALVAAGAILFTWLREGRDTLPLSQLLLVPLYIGWKLPLYFAMALRQGPHWNRAERFKRSDRSGGV